MNCHELNRMLETTNAIDRSAADDSAIERHFSSCKTCRSAWSSFAEIVSEQIPAISPELHSRIDQLIAARLPAQPRSIRRTLIGGSVLVLGVAAATMVFQVGDREREVLATQSPPSPATESLLPTETEEAPLTGIRANDVARGDQAGSAADVAPIPTSYALDMRSVVVIANADQDLDLNERAILDECRNGVVARLRGLLGLNVISGVAVTAFQETGMENGQIARELGAGSVLSLDELAVCHATLSDARTGAFIAGRGLARAFVTGGVLTFDTDDLDWDHFYDGLARMVNDALLIEEAALIAEAQAAFLNTSLGVDDRFAALYRTTASTGSLPEAVFDQAVIFALIQIMTTSADLQHRRDAVLSVRGVDDAVLIDPLLYVLNHDSEMAVRTVAASTLHEYVDEPRVSDALRRIVADDPDDDLSMICCEFNLGQVARRALASDDELRQLSMEQLMNTELNDFQRLRPLSDYPDGRDVMYLSRTNVEAHSNVVFSIGRDSDDAAVRSHAWSVLARGTRNPAYVPTLLDDLSTHGDEDVRHSAAQALAPYADDAEVRAALERALETDSCECLRSILEPVVQAE